jgi:hypothetical protein
MRYADSSRLQLANLCRDLGFDLIFVEASGEREPGKTYQAVAESWRAGICRRQTRDLPEIEHRRSIY